MNKKEYFECHCGAPEHRLVFDFDDGHDEHSSGVPPEITTEVHLYNYRGFFKRSWLAIKYIFGYKCKYGHFDNFSLDPKDALRLKSLLTEYIKAHNKWVRSMK